jgi:tRNA nucleotidyltransferase (CCA-adding enzyme)
MKPIIQEQKTEEQRMKENAEYLAHRKKEFIKKNPNRDISHLVGSISKETAEKMLKHIENERNNW